MIKLRKPCKKTENQTALLISINMALAHHENLTFAQFLYSYPTVFGLYVHKKGEPTGKHISFFTDLNDLRKEPWILNANKDFNSKTTTLVTVVDTSTLTLAQIRDICIRK